MQILAAVARAPQQPFSLEMLELAAPRADEVLVRIVATGVCHTDVAMRDQIYPVPQPVVLGHEGAGVVQSVGNSVTDVSVGDHVVISFNYCGDCPSCRHGAPNYCHEYFQRNFAAIRADGTSALSNGGELIHGHFFGQSSFATHAICHAANVVVVPKDLPLEYLGPLACGLQTGAGAVFISLDLKADESIAVFGVGTVGLAAIMAAKVRGAKHIIAIDLHDSRLALARELGATQAYNPATTEVAKEIGALFSDGVDACLDTTGRPQVLEQAFSVLAPRGTCAVVGAAPPNTEAKFDMTFLMTGGRSIRGVVEGDARPKEFIPLLIELYRRGEFPFDRLIKTFPLSKINEAVEAAVRGAVIKPVIVMDSKSAAERT